VITSNGGGDTAAVNVPENTTAVTTVTATDPDAGQTATLTFSISGGADAAKFTINPTTGALSFVTAPNFEAPTDANADNVYLVTVRATDTGTLFDEQALSVTVTNVNEAPVITSNGGGDTAAVNVPENTTAVTTVTATDPDAGQTATLAFSISGGADAAKFSINATTGALSFVTAPNFEAPTDANADNVYLVTVRATDTGTLFDEQALSVTVTNVNEAPVAANDAFTAQSATLLTVAAPGVLGNDTDPDAGTTLTAVLGTTTANGTLVLNSNGSFTYTSNAGFTGPDTFTYRASDGSLTSNLATVTITVGEIPNRAPVITSNGGGDTAAINVPENTTAVTTVTATDLDNDTLTFGLAGGADQSKFTINATTGVLSFATAPNFEAPTDANADNVYLVTVQVSDGRGGVDTQAISVTVTNVNEVPVITSNGGGDTAAVNVPENTTAVTTVTATDPDAGQTATLVFSISGGADAAKFTINSTTGVLSFITAPNFEAPTDANADNVYLVTVRATDSGTLFDEQALSVTVTNVNEAPVITSNGGGDTAAVNVPENTTAVTTVTATDPDAGQTATLTFSISGGADAAKFNINATTGALSFITAPDFEAPTDANADNVYLVTVRATDSGGLFDQQALSVTVTNVVEVDLGSILAARNTPALGPNDPRDLDGDGMITILDARKFLLLNS
jgi:hypothetical protein